VPDIQAIGKGLGGGYAPVAGLLINKRVVDALDKGTGSFSHGQTYQGHPVGCAAALEVQRIIREENLVENVAKRGDEMARLLRERLESNPYVGNIRGKGLFWGVSALPRRHRNKPTDEKQIEFVQDKKTKEPFDPKRGVAMAIHEKGPSTTLVVCTGCRMLTTPRHGGAVQYFTVSRHGHGRRQERRPRSHFACIYGYIGRS